LPGDLLGEANLRTGENTYRNQGKVLASRVGLVEYDRGGVSVIALRSNYEPRLGENVVGCVVDVELGNWTVDIDAPSEAVLNVSDALGEPFRPEMSLPRFFDRGNIILARIVSLARDGTPILSTLEPGLGKIHGGRLVRMTSSKIPRLIGKRGSMVNMILKETGCQIIIGQNGIIVVNCRDRDSEELVVSVLDKIENEAHTSGLTNRVYEYIKKVKEKS